MSMYDDFRACMIAICEPIIQAWLGSRIDPRNVNYEFPEVEIDTDKFTNDYIDSRLLTDIRDDIAIGYDIIQPYHRLDMINIIEILDKSPEALNKLFAASPFISDSEYVDYVTHRLETENGECWQKLQDESPYKSGERTIAENPTRNIDPKLYDKIVILLDEKCVSYYRMFSSFWRTARKSMAHLKDTIHDESIDQYEALRSIQYMAKFARIADEWYEYDKTKCYNDIQAYEKQHLEDISRVIDNTPLMVCSLHRTNTKKLKKTSSVFNDEIWNRTMNENLALRIEHEIRSESCVCHKKLAFESTFYYGPASGYYISAIMVRAYLDIRCQTFINILLLTRSVYKITDNNLFPAILNYMIPQYPLVREFIDYAQKNFERNKCRNQQLTYDARAY